MLFPRSLVVREVMWFLTEEENFKIPDILCSAVDHVAETYCDVKVLSPSAATSQLKDTYGDEALEIPFVETGLAFGRLSSPNPYHTLFEDTVPVHQILKEDSLLSDWLSDQPKLSALILFPDHNHNFEFSHKFWSRFFPNVTYVVTPPAGDFDEERFKTSMKAYRVNYLVAGSNNSCAHYFHCSRGEYTDSKAVVDLRNFLFHKVGVIPRNSRGQDSARILIVQRGGSRRMRNIDEIVEIVKSTSGVLPKVEDLGMLSIDEQIKLIYDSDIIIMMHGGALAHLMFMAEHAALVEFYPFSWPFEFHGLVNWVRYSMSDVPIRHFPFDIRDPRHMFYRFGHLPLCLCDTSQRSSWYSCGVDLYWNLMEFEVHPGRFEEHFSIAWHKWDTIAPITPPVNKSEFKKFSLAMKEPSYHPFVRKAFKKQNLGSNTPPNCQKELQFAHYGS